VGRVPSLRVFTLEFALQLRKKHDKTSGRVVRHKYTMRIIAITIQIHKLHYQKEIKYNLNNMKEDINM
jgi:hypothetical protein